MWTAYSCIHFIPLESIYNPRADLNIKPGKAKWPAPDSRFGVLLERIQFSFVQDSILKQCGLPLGFSVSDIAGCPSIIPWWVLSHLTDICIKHMRLQFNLITVGKPHNLCRSLNGCFVMLYLHFVSSANVQQIQKINIYYSFPCRICIHLTASTI